MSSNEDQVQSMLACLERPMPLIDQDDQSSIARFYSGRSVFVTGATGFLGKALVEKLVRSCPGIKRIYLLIREKRGKNVQERLNDLIATKSFDRIRELNDGSNELLENILRPIQGDITLPKFGISSDDMKILSNECNIVFNSAATIRFSEPINIAVRNNVYSVDQLVEFCNGLAKLEALVHLSTAYSNCHKSDTIYEIFYEPPMQGKVVLEAMKQLKELQSKMHVYPCDPTNSQNELPDFTNESFFSRVSRSRCQQNKFYFDGLNSDQLLEKKSDTDEESSQGELYNLIHEFDRIALRRSNRPNTYTFTKAVSENHLLDLVKSKPERYLEDKIPVAVVRPSVVAGAWREPLVGLVDNFNGPTGATVSLYTGALQAMPGDGENVADMVPVDMVVNMVIATGWYLASGQRQMKSVQEDEIKPDQGVYVFNMVSNYQNACRWHQLLDGIAILAYKYPTKFLARLPSSYFFRRVRYYNLYDFINQRLPAQLSDWIRKYLLAQRVEGRSSSMASYWRIKQMTETLTPFTSNQWRICDSNTRHLFERLEPIDKNIFHFDVKSIDWTAYLDSFIIGTRIYMLKDLPENLKAATRALERCKTIYLCCMITLLFLALSLIFRCFMLY